jgi:hypothetical protein
MRPKPQLHATYIRMRARKCNESYARVISLLSCFRFHSTWRLEWRQSRCAWHQDRSNELTMTTEIDGVRANACLDMV